MKILTKCRNCLADRVDAIELPTVTDSSGKPLFTGLYSGPYFDLRRMAKNQTAQIGDNVLIHCAVKQAGQRAVSQIHVDTTVDANWFRLKITDALHRARKHRKSGSQWSTATICID